MNTQNANDGLVQATASWKQFHWFLQYLIAVVGLLVVLSSSYALYRGIDIYRKYFPLVKASMEMRLKATTAYLWFEEMMGGDESKRLSDILKQLDLADWYAAAMIEGGESSQINLLPLGDSTMRNQISGLRGQLARQRELLLNRMNIDGDAGPGSGIDLIYHATLENFISDANLFEVQVEHLIAKNFRIFRDISIGVIIFSTFLFLIVGYAFYRYESLRRKNYAELLEMQDMLIQKEKMVALGTMMAGIAHEINNPNTAIALNVPLLKEYLAAVLPVVDQQAGRHTEFKVMDMPYAKFKTDLLQLADHIEQGSSRITRTVSTLMNFSRNKKQTKMRRFDLGGAIDTVVEICGAKIDASVASFEVTIAEDAPDDIYFDAEILELSLINLLNNAAEAADKPDAWIKLNVFLDADRTRRAVVFEVKDNGCGIKESDRQRIFEPFFSTKSSKGGTGLGLYLCYTLLHQIGAAITLESEVGVGSAFRIVIPDA